MSKCMGQTNDTLVSHSQSPMTKLLPDGGFQPLDMLSELSVETELLDNSLTGIF